jgi:hypothetical protein
MEIANPRDAISRLDEDERRVATTDTPGGPQTLNVINETGLYSPDPHESQGGSQAVQALGHP